MTAPDAPGNLPNHSLTIAPQVAERFAQNYLSHYLGFEMIEGAEGRCQIELTLRNDHMQNLGIAHGGTLATIADTAMGFAASSLQAKDSHVVTGEMKISFLNPAMGTRLKAKGWCLKSGRRVVFTEGEVYCQKDQNAVWVLVAKASSSMIVIGAAAFKG